MDSEQLKITPSESVTVRESGPGRLEVEVVYAPGGSPPPAHYHPQQDEHFRVLAGELHVRVGDEDERVLREGDELAIPRRTVHRMWNPGGDRTRATWATSPAGRTLDWFRAIDALHREGKVGKNGMPGPLAFGVLLSEYDDVFRLAAKPEPVVRAALTAVGAVGRLRGYSADPPLRSPG